MGTRGRRSRSVGLYKPWREQPPGESPAQAQPPHLHVLLRSKDQALRRLKTQVWGGGVGW